MRAKRLICGAAAIIAVAGIGVPAIAAGGDGPAEPADTVELTAPADQRAEIEATLAAVSAELPE